jgi:hypothetical protein
MIKSKNFRLLFILILTGCVDSFPTPRLFIIENKSKVGIEIRYYVNKILKNNIALKNNQSFRETIRGSKGLNPYKFNADSIEIIFDKRKKIVQYCGGKTLVGNDTTDCYIEKNLMDFGFGVGKKSKLSSKITRTITFDESDYEKAKEL